MSGYEECREREAEVAYGKERIELLTNISTQIMELDNTDLRFVKHVANNTKKCITSIDFIKSLFKL